jgi:hypothetical protein
MKTMNNTAKEVLRLSALGYCCSQIMVQMGLNAKQEENPELLDAVSGLCGGLHSGLCCGILTGAACLLALFDKNRAAEDLIPRLVEWFKASYTPPYGGISCNDIICGNRLNIPERCPKIMEETIERCRELLAEIGYEI